jgi:c-di-GMP-binding flagellar brake protein YcgR
MSDLIAGSPPAESFLTVGHPLKISLTRHGQKAMYGTTLLGWKEHAWLVCEWPAQLGHDTAIPGGTPCTVSYLHEGKLVGYRTDIRDTMTSPVPLLFLAFPQTVEEMHLRKHVRVSSCEPALLIRPNGAGGASDPIPPTEIAGGMVKDVSLEGCSVALAHVPSWVRPGVTIRMEFELPGLGHVTNLTAVVKNRDARDGTQLVGLAFQFDGMEYIEYRGWGGSVKQAIEQWTIQKSTNPLQHR